jgi:y4mF family transcriptional regulator
LSSLDDSRNDGIERRPIMPTIRTAADVGLTIREQRKRLGLSQAALAERVGVSRQWIVDVEKGKARAELALVLRTLDVLGLGLYVAAPPVRPSVAPPSPFAAVDIDAIIDRARGRG